MMMRSLRNILLLLLLPLCVSCVGTRDTKVLTVSIAPEQYFLHNIVGEGYKINVLVPPGMNPEAYDPTPRDIALLSKSSVYFYIGTLGFEKVWVDRIKDRDSDLRCINISGYLVPDAPTTASSSHSHEDPHYWSSIVGANAISKGIYDALISIYPDSAQHFAANYDRLTRKIKDVEDCGRAILSHATSKAFVIYHPSLTYFAHEWGLKQLVIEEDGKSPSPAHLQALIAEARRDSVQVVFVQREFDRKVATTIAEAIGAKLYEINPFDSDWSGQMKHIFRAFAPDSLSVTK